MHGSFFRYLSETFGQEAVLRLAYSDDEMTPTLFAQVFGRTFDALEQGWHAQAVRAFEATADAVPLARAYRNTVSSPLRHGVAASTTGGDNGSPVLWQCHPSRA